MSFFFYKNVLLGVTLFLYDGHTFFSGQQLYNDSYLSGYNIIFVAFPILVVGVWDQDVSERMAAVYPQLYQQVRYSDGTVANRYARVWHGATENGSLNDGQIPQKWFVLVHASTGYNRVAGNRRASRNGRVSDHPPEIFTVTIRNLFIAVRVCSGALIPPAWRGERVEVSAPLRYTALLAARCSS